MVVSCLYCTSFQLFTFFEFAMITLIGGLSLSFKVWKGVAKLHCFEIFSLLGLIWWVVVFIRNIVIYLDLIEILSQWFSFHLDTQFKYFLAKIIYRDNGLILKENHFLKLISYRQTYKKFKNEAKNSK